MREFIAHIKQDKKDTFSQPHQLDEHLLKVSTLAASKAIFFDANFAGIAGVWHDLGKYQHFFQEYIRNASGYERENAHVESEGRPQRKPHSTAGARYAIDELPSPFGHVIAYLIAGHHAGLADWDGGKSSLNYRLKESNDEYKNSLLAEIPEQIIKPNTKLSPPNFIRDPKKIALWMRMLFSALVDADFLDTESYMSPEKKLSRNNVNSLNILSVRFFNYISELQKKSESSRLNVIRNDIYKACISAGANKPGIYSLTVPTGGGKTLSSMGFALEHARVHKKQRIIYAIPFTSIIEQNASVFNSIMGDDAVLEHHSSLDVKPNEESSRSRLNSENWDSPIIVTTNVQLFESLHASRTSRCRKLHNITNSVIVLDEAQQLPRDFHAPITEVMQQLSDHFGVTWLLCTATQPNLKKTTDPFGKILFKGLNDITEIIETPSQLANSLKRVEVKMPVKGEPRLTIELLANEVATQDCVLIIVNTRKQCRELYRALPYDGNSIHLSAQMCASHRSSVIKEIKERLKSRKTPNTNEYNRPLMVISTQLIEAGVDVDFPVVYRCMAGLDSIAQSAGRCNREDAMDVLGKVVVFRFNEKSPPGFLRQAEDVTEEMLANGMLTEPLAPDNFTTYFSLLNGKGDRDLHGIVNQLTAIQTQDIPLGINFRTAAEKFKLIDNNGIALVVPYEPKKSDSPIWQWLDILEKDASAKWIYKKLQRYTITVPESFAIQLEKAGALQERAGLFVVCDGFYDEMFGLIPPDHLLSAEESII